MVHAWFSDVYKMPLCLLGSVSNIEHTLSQSLQEIHQDIKEQVQTSTAIHLDETGHKECNKNGWAWIMSTLEATYFKLAPSHGRKIAKELIGDFRSHIYVTDLYSAYDFLPDEKTGELCLYSMSYLGNVEYAHSRQYYDSFIEFSHLRSTAPIIQLEKKADILSDFVIENNIKKLQRNKSNYFTPFSYNTGDVDQDGKHDFILGGKLLLSSNNYAPLINIDLPPESIFLKVGQETLIISLDNNFLRVFRYQLSQLVQLSNVYLKSRAYSDISHVLFPLPLNKNCLPMLAVRSQCGLDIYVVNEKMELELKWWIIRLIEGEALIGAFGNFIEKPYIDFWISQIATGTRRENSCDQILLISAEKLLNSPDGEVLLSEVLHFTIKGSAKFSDYDGISTSLSPVAGDIDGDGKPDLSFVGHRHMNEEGALYILLNKDIKKGESVDITDRKIIKIVGKPMCQIAPPYVNWDANDLSGDGYSDIIIAADNDLYSGINAGALYILDGKKIINQWKTKQAEIAYEIN
ncbi:transposase [Legionella pneumophila serogroup 9]